MHRISGPSLGGLERKTLIERLGSLAVDEHRKFQRHRVLKAGKITFNHGAGIDCTVRNLSSAGACLEVVSPLGIPDDFILLIGDNHDQHSCHIAWRHEKRIGVNFK